MAAALPIRAHAQSREVAVPLARAADVAATIERAIGGAIARANARGGRAAPIVIRLPAGQFRLRRPIRIGSTDGGSPGAPLIIRGAGSQATILDGAWPLIPAGPGLKAALTRLRARLPKAARPNVRYFTLPAGLAHPSALPINRFHAVVAPPVAFEIFDAAGALQPARWPNTGWTDGAAHPANARAIAVPEAALRSALWRGEPELWAEGYPGQDWSFEAFSAAGLREPGLIAVTGPPPRYGIRARFRLTIRHAAAELDQLGEWYFDRGTGLLAVWPRAGGTLSASVAISAIVIAQAAHVRLEDFAVRHVRGDALRIMGGLDVTAARLDVRWAAGRGAVIEGARASGISGSRLTDLGEGGISLSGGDRPRLAAGRLHARDNRIERFSRLGRTYKAAIRLAGVGNSATGNWVADGPHLAVHVRGNDHVIRLNEITNVAYETSDAGAVYAGRDVTERGTIIEHNVLRDIRAASGFEIKGIYLDDFTSGYTVRENVFLRVDQPVFIGGGSDNHVIGNVFVSASPAVHVDARGLTWARSALTDPLGTLRQGFQAMPVSSPRWHMKYPSLAGFPISVPHAPRRIVVSGNVLVASDALRLELPATRAALVPGGAPAFFAVPPPSAEGLPPSATADEVLAALARRLRDPAAVSTLRRIIGQRLDRRPIMKP